MAEGSMLSPPVHRFAVVAAEGRLPGAAIVEAEQLPTHLVRIAAVGRIREHARDGRGADGFEEWFPVLVFLVLFFPDLEYLDLVIGGELGKPAGAGPPFFDVRVERRQSDRKSTRLNSSHVSISYAVFCLKK